LGSSGLKMVLRPNLIFLLTIQKQCYDPHVAAAVSNTTYNAIGVRIYNLPITQEKQDGLSLRSFSDYNELDFIT
jgi:hypothetical protein